MAHWLKPNHFKPGSNSLISFSFWIIMWHIDVWLTQFLSSFLNGYLLLPKIYGNHNSNVANTSDLVLREALTHWKNYVYTSVTQTWTAVNITYQRVLAKHTWMWVYHRKLQDCCSEVFSVWIIQIIYSCKNICCWFNVSNSCFFQHWLPILTGGCVLT